MRILAVLIVILHGTAPVLAADPATAPPPWQPPVEMAPAPVKKPFDWRRCYAGVVTGTKDVRTETDLPLTDFFDPLYIDKATSNLGGPVFGAQIGCNYVQEGGFLLGLELEGLYGYKYTRECETRIDPLSYCIDHWKDVEGFASVRFGKIYENAFGCDCAGSTFLLYGKAGIGYTRTRIAMNINALSYGTVDTDGDGISYPDWAYSADLKGKANRFAPLIGVGLEVPILTDWTLRGEMTVMYSRPQQTPVTVNKRSYPYGNTVETYNDSTTRIKRSPVLGDVIPLRMRELETVFKISANSYF